MTDLHWTAEEESLLSSLCEHHPGDSNTTIAKLFVDQSKGRKRTEGAVKIRISVKGEQLISSLAPGCMVLFCLADERRSVLAGLRVPPAAAKPSAKPPATPTPKSKQRKSAAQRRPTEEDEESEEDSENETVPDSNDGHADQPSSSDKDDDDKDGDDKDEQQQHQVRSTRSLSAVPNTT